VAPVFVLFYATNARDQVKISVDSKNKALISICEKLGLAHTVESDDSFAGKSADAYNTVHVTGDKQTSFPMAGQFVSLYFPLGHIKSTKPNDDEFTLKLDQLSQKWLTTLF
jgi:hypothetical protein